MKTSDNHRGRSPAQAAAPRRPAPLARVAGLVLAGAVFALAAGCGSDHNDSNDGAAAAPSAGVPSDAAATPTSFVSYLKQVVGLSSDSAEPLPLGDLKGPTDETSEPAAVATSG